MTLRDNLISALTAAITKAVDDVLGTGPTASRAPVDVNAVLGEAFNKVQKPRARKGQGKKAGPVTAWVADKAAKRVPLFVQKATGLVTKASVQAKFGDGSSFVQQPDGTVTVNGKALGVPAKATPQAAAAIGKGARKGKKAA